MVPHDILPARVNQHVAIIRINPLMADPLYVLYCINSPEYKDHLLTLSQGGATREALPKSTIGNFEIFLPSLANQSKIAALLSAYDGLIENNTRRIKILEGMAQAIYREWFVNFHFLGHEKVQMVDSTLGEIPEGWDVYKLYDICELVNYGYTASSTNEPIGPKFLRITDIVPYMIDWESVPYCDLPEDYLEKYLLREGDIVIARTGATVGFAKRINKRHPESIFASYLVRIRIKDDYDNYYVGLVVESDEYKRFIKSNVGGAAQPNANARVLTSFPILIPSKEIKNQFRQNLEYIFDQREILQEKNAVLRRTRDLMLPNLISGELNVENLDILMEGINS